MNLLDYIIQENALGDKDKRMKIINRVIGNQITTSITITPQTPNFTSTADSIRFALSATSKPYDVSPLTVSKYLNLLCRMAEGEPCDIDLLKKIKIIGEVDKIISQNNVVPGTYEPRNSIGKLAIKAAWEIEQKTTKLASRDEVMTLLIDWAINGNKADLLVKADEFRSLVFWSTVNESKLKEYDLNACGKTLSKWKKSRKIP